MSSFAAISYFMLLLSCKWRFSCEDIKSRSASLSSALTENHSFGDQKHGAENKNQTSCLASLEPQWFLSQVRDSEDTVCSVQGTDACLEERLFRSAGRESVHLGLAVGSRGPLRLRSQEANSCADGGWCQGQS